MNIHVFTFRFAKPDAIIDLWEKYNVSNGADILLVSQNTQTFNIST